MPTEPHDAARAFFRAHPVPPGATLLCAVSGGADSMTLLTVLADLREEMGFRLAAGHLNHGQRADADRDVERVAAASHALDVPLEAGSADVPGLARERRESLEVAGRAARYAFLYRTALARGAFAVCTGHTLDDQAETVMLRIAAGTGLAGLGGIAPARLAGPPECAGPIWLYRPLLAVPRAVTAAFCASRGISVLDDPVNRDPRYPRNRVRETLLPLMQSAFNPEVRTALARLAEIARADEAFLREAAAAALPLDSVPGGAAADVEAFEALPLALRRRAARRMLEQAGAHGKPLGFENTEAVLAAAAERAPARALRGGMTACVRGMRLLVVMGAAEQAPVAYEAAVACPGVTALPVGTLRAEIVEGAVISRDHWVATLDADRLAGALSVRNRRAGDRMHPLGAPGTRTLADICTDRKVPRETRDRLPVLLCGDRVAWLAGVAVEEGFRVTGETRRTARFTLECPHISTE